MSIYSLNIPYPNFEIGKVIDPSEFNANNGAIQTKVNEVVNAVNNINIVDDDGNVVVPSYIKETFIDPVEIKSPLLTGNTLLGASGIVGMTSIGTSNDSIRIWAGSSDKDSAPFRVAHDGTVTMTKAKIETKSDANGLYITMEGSKISGGRTTQPNSYMLGTASTTAGSRSGVLQVQTYKTSESTTPEYVAQFSNNAIMYRGSNFVIGNNLIGESKPVIITKSMRQDDFEKIVPGDATLHVQGSINLTGDIYINGVKMALTPA